MQTAIELYFVILWISAGSYLMLLFIFITGWLKTKEFQPTLPMDGPQVSVVIAVRNEAHRLDALFASLKHQKYDSKRIEVVMIDDHSEDNSYQIMERYRISMPRLIVLKATGYGKKAALKQGFSVASGELIVTTDADCTFEPGWISGLVSCFVEEKPMLLFGPVVYQNQETLLQKFFTLEFLSLVASGAGSLGMKLPLSGNAANMAFSGLLLPEVLQMEEGESHASGDDVFLMHYIARRYGADSVRFVRSRQVLVKTVSPQSLKAFIRQRIRWGSKAPGYRLFWPKLVALVVFLFNFMVFATLVAGFVRPELWILYSLLVLMKFLADYPLLKGFSVFTRKECLLPYSLLFELIYPLYLTFTAILSLWMPFAWKGRGGLR